MATSPISDFALEKRCLSPDRLQRPRAWHWRGAAARFPYALWLLQGRRRSVRARLCAQLRPPHRGAADELHLRPAPDGHGGPGLGRPFPDPRTRRRADHALRRRLSGARHPRRVAMPSSAYLAAWAQIDAVAGPRLQSRRRAGQCGQPAPAARRISAELLGRAVDVGFSDWRAGDQRYFVADTRAADAALGLGGKIGWRIGVRTSGRVGSPKRAWARPSRSLAPTEAAGMSRRTPSS